MATIDIYASSIEETAVEQVNSISALPPFENAHIAIMPDAHAGAGCVIGFTADTTEAVVPNMVGVDVGCGLLAVELAEEKSTDLLHAMDRAAYKRVPSAHQVHNEAKISKDELKEYECSFKNGSRLIRSLGTLGGGNHFLELDEAPDGHLWLVIHTGSRNLGLQVANYWQDVAIAHCDNSVPRAQRWLEGDKRDGYLHDMGLAQEFARRNREAIAQALLDETGVKVTGERIESVHNYIDLEHNVVRKGAIAAYDKQRLIIPLNMAAGCIIATGKGNDAWNYSAPHGAGRAMSRKAAFETLSLEAYQESMVGIYSTSVCQATLDEAPAAYKDAAAIEADIAPTVDIEFVMRPVWNFKASA